MDSWNNDALILEEDMECQLLSEIPILPEVFLALFGNIHTLNQTLGTWTVFPTTILVHYTVHSLIHSA